MKENLSFGCSVLFLMHVSVYILYESDYVFFGNRISIRGETFNFCSEKELDRPLGIDNKILKV